MATKKFLSSAVKRPGAFTAAAKRRHLTPAELQAKVLAHPEDYPLRLVRQASYRKAAASANRGRRR